MTLNLSKTLLTVSATILLVAASATSSDARPHGKRLAPTQGEPAYYHSDFDIGRDRDSSCFSRSVGLPVEYACSSNGG
jgi:hypothetical protein